MQALAQVALIGFGEAATAFVKGWGDYRPEKVTAYDIKTDSEITRAAKLADYHAAGINGVMDLESAIAGADAIFSLVSADQAGRAASSAARIIRAGQFFFDCNSCSPDTKKTNAGLIEAAGGFYIDAAVMAPVSRDLHHTPLLISGVAGESAIKLLSVLDMKAQLISGGVGKPSSIKMIRSIMIKGLEALNAECLLAARKAGVDQTILRSLEKSFPGFGWEKQSGYMLERMMVHGVRRAAEMSEVAKTIEQLGLSDAMTRSTIEWQQRIGDMQLQPESEEFGSLADLVLEKL
ncbi:MAG: DUF1932 domain-containing protein [Amphritea sp.]